MASHPNEFAPILDELIHMGMNLARAVYAEGMNASAPNPAHVAAFERISRTVRRTVLLARKLAEAPTREARHQAARARIIREVEDAIARAQTGTAAPAQPGAAPATPEAERAETLRAELVERLDDPALPEDLDTQSLPALIQDIRRDLGLDPLPGTPLWQRRTPADIRRLRQRAAPPDDPRSAPRPGQPGSPYRPLTFPTP